MNIYSEKPYLKPSFLQKIFGKEPKGNVVIEINNFLALQQAAIEVISSDKISEITSKYKVGVKELKTTFREQLNELFRKYLRYCLEDCKLGDGDISSLKRLRDALFVDEKDAEELIKVEAEAMFEQQVQIAISDRRLDESDKTKLETISKDLLIPDDTGKEIYKRVAIGVITEFVKEAISDTRFSPDEEKEMNEIATNIGVDLEIDENTKKILDKYRLYWRIENGDLPEVVSDITIQKSETLHFVADIKWCEQRKVTNRINYGGPTARIKLMKGVYYRAGSMGIQRISEDVMQTIDSGRMYLTNKRLIFMGDKGNKTIAINKILDINPFTNGVDIQKDSGKSPFLEFSEGVDIFSMILVRLMGS